MSGVLSLRQVPVKGEREGIRCGVTQGPRGQALLRETLRSVCTCPLAPSHAMKFLLTLPSEI